MSVMCDKVINLAQRQVGYKESGTNQTKYSRWFDNEAWQWFNTKKQGAEWCAIFVCWLFCQDEIIGPKRARTFLGCPAPKYNYAAGVDFFWGYLKARKWQVDKKAGLPGDIIFFNTSKGPCGHVGIIEKVDDSKYYTIEGNKSNQVKRCSYTRSSTTIYGLMRPAWSEIEPSPEPPTPTGTTYKVATKYQHLEIRKEPTTKSEDIGDLAKGSTFTSSIVVKGESVHGCDAWVGVNGGYANGYYLEPTPVYKVEKPEPLPIPEPVKPTPVYPKYKVKTVTGEWLALRIAPNTKAILIVRMDYGAEVDLVRTVTGEKKYGSNEWAYVNYTKNGRTFTGYCIKSRLKKI